MAVGPKSRAPYFCDGPCPHGPITMWLPRRAFSVAPFWLIPTYPRRVPWLKMSNQPPNVCTGTEILANSSSAFVGFQYAS